MNTSQKTRRLTVSALMLATATVLAMICEAIPFLHLPFGGGFTIASMLPIVLIAYMYGTKWGLLCSATYSAIQILMAVVFGSASLLRGYFIPTDKNFMGFGVAIGIVVLDYIVAYTVLGLGGIFRNKLPKLPAIILGVVLVLSLRYLTHIISGYFFFGDWAAETLEGWGKDGFAVGPWVLDHFTGQMVAVVYSIIYNGLYMIPEIIITAICGSGVAFIPYIKKYDVKS